MTCKCVLNELTPEDIRKIRLAAALNHRRCLVCDKWFAKKGKKIYCSAECRIQHEVAKRVSKEEAKTRQLQSLQEENDLLLKENVELKLALDKLRRGICD